jgi:RNA polymerase sigma factor (sigma-70 family)
MDDQQWLTQRFEEHRSHLHAVARRMLGSESEAEDAVQEAWLRLNRADTSDVENLGGWLTTVVARVSLDMLRSRAARREHPLDLQEVDAPASGPDPAEQAALAEAVGPALLVVLDTLSPLERLAFVLHDLFAVPFDEIAPIVGRSPAAARQLASRARRRVQGADPATAADRARQREIVHAFLAAARGGDLAALLRLLDPDVVLRADAAAVSTGVSPRVVGAQAVAQTFAGRARAARPALVDGLAGLAWLTGGVPRVVFDFVVRDGQIVAIELLADAETLSGLELELAGA